MLIILAFEMKMKIKFKLGFDFIRFDSDSDLIQSDSIRSDLREFNQIKLIRQVQVGMSIIGLRCWEPPFAVYLTLMIAISVVVPL